MLLQTSHKKSKSTPCTEWQPNNLKLFPTRKVIRVSVKEQGFLEIGLPDTPVTCQWLLNEVVRRVQGGSQRVAALKTTSGNETMDYYLTLDTR